MIFYDTPEDKKILHDFWTTSKINYNVKIYKMTPNGKVEIKRS